jgi:hypothetical protein
MQNLFTLKLFDSETFPLSELQAPESNQDTGLMKASWAASRACIA